MEKKLVRGYFEKENVVGNIIFMDYITGEVILRGIDADEEDYSVKFEDVVELESLGFLNGVEVFNHDVLVDNEGVKYELERNSFNSRIYMYRLDDEYNKFKFSPVGDVPSGYFVNFKQIEEYFSTEGNVFVLRNSVPKVDLDFNIKVYKVFDSYYYACNNKEAKEIDLIKVIYVGHYLLEEETYERNTYTHTEFIDLVVDKYIIEASPMELLSFVSGQTKFSTHTSTPVQDSDDCEDEDLWEDGDYECDDCEDEDEDTDFDMDYEDENLPQNVEDEDDVAKKILSKAFDNLVTFDDLVENKKFIADVIEDICSVCKEDILDCDCGELF